MTFCKGCGRQMTRDMESNQFPGYCTIPRRDGGGAYEPHETIINCEESRAATLAWKEHLSEHGDPRG